MITGQYQLTVTCTECGKLDGGYKSLTVFTGKDSMVAKDKMLNAGWKIDLTKGTQTCPACAKGAI